MSKKRTPEERRTMLIAILEQKQFVSSSELCERLESSESTIRRDLELMENKGQIERVHGGAILSKHIFEEPSFMQSKDMNYEEKMRIAEAACSLNNAARCLICSSQYLFPPCSSMYLSIFCS